MNEQIQVVLASPGIEQPNSQGESEWRYFLEGERVMWVPTHIHQAIHAATNGEPIGKAFVIQRYKPGTAPFVWQIKAGATAPPQNGHNGSSYTATQQPAQTQPKCWCGAAADYPNADGKGTPMCSRHAYGQNTAAMHSPQTGKPANQMQPGEVALSLGDSLAGAFCAAIDAAGEAITYAKSKGLQLSFSTGDIRAMAATLFMAEQERGQA
jgi:hypothetical protein